MNGVAISGVTVNQGELMESDEHLRWILEQIEIAKEEQEAAEAASAALKQPEAHRTPLKCYKRQQIPMPENAEVSDELQAWLQACSLFVTPREWLRMLQLRYLAITPMLQENFEELSAAERRPYEEESMLDLRRYHTACEEHTASKEAAQKLCFEKNKLVARYCASLKKERASNAIARADVAADAAAIAAAAAAAVPPPTLLLGTLYGHELYGIAWGGLTLTRTQTLALTLTLTPTLTLTLTLTRYFLRGPDPHHVRPGWVRRTHET